MKLRALKGIKKNERLRHVLAAFLVACLLSWGGILDPLDQVIWATEARFAPKPASGDIVFVGTPVNLADPNQPQRRSDLAAALTTLDRSGVKHVFLNVVFDKPGSATDDKALATAIAKLGSRITLARWSVREFGQPTTKASLPEISGLSGEVSVYRNIDALFGYTWQMPYALKHGNKINPNLPTAIAGLKTWPSGEFQIDYNFSYSSIPHKSLAQLTDDGGNAADLRGKTVLIGSLDTGPSNSANIPGHIAVPASYVSIYAAETLKAGIPLAISGLAPALLTAIALIATAMLTAFRRRRRAIYTALTVISPLSALVVFHHGTTISYAPVASLFAIFAGLRFWSTKTRQQTLQDALTGLPNFRALQKDIAKSKNASAIAIIVAKIHRYDEVLSTLPKQHHADYVLEIANRFRIADLELAVYKDDGKYLAWTGPGNDREQLESHLKGLRAVFTQPIRIADSTIDVGITFGVDDTADTDPARKLSTANSAADRSTEAHQPIIFAEQSAEVDRIWNISLQAKIDEALEKRHIYVVFQPQVSLRTGDLVGAEALVRWNDPERGFISPAYFIEQCEQAGRMDTLTKRVLEDAITAAGKFTSPGQPFSMSVNISATMLQDDHVYQMVKNVIEQTGFDPHNIILEITETAKISDYSAAASVMERLLTLGVRFSIDDFGVGAANFETLLRLPFDELKVDRTFVALICSNPKAREITAQLIELGNKARITVVAEGIEDAQTLEELRHMGCHVAQGYWISRPLEFKNFVEFQQVDAAKRAIVSMNG
jgi:EAL domain-containing protein (putative c-di-GMP-specific phosphodiesterase class I)/CHASE2 domain-containing sensor protein